MLINNISYVDLSPELDNDWADMSHDILADLFGSLEIPPSKDFISRPEFNVNLILATRVGQMVTEAKGPDISNKDCSMDYVIYLKFPITSMPEYIDEVLKGISQFSTGLNPATIRQAILGRLE